MKEPGPLPALMVSPTGARRTKADHPALPMSLDEIVEAAVACAKAGATGLHLHVRDKEGRHSIDVGRYREALDALHAAAPDLYVQVTSEAAGRYSPAEQRAMVRALRPAHVSVAFREMTADPAEDAEVRAFYHFARDEGIDIQHIAFSERELSRLIAAIDDGTIPGTNHLVQLVLGTYDGRVRSNPAMIAPFLAPMEARRGVLSFDHMVCAFGREETRCLVEAVNHGSKARVGFENSIWNDDGRVATDIVERVVEVATAIAGTR
ncbi:MAG: 3-keto-5-aminohexanoate cleavage protein [Pseudomonadota bacterium]